MKTLKKIGLALVMTTISSTVFAASAPNTATESFNSTATVTSACEVKVSPLSFGIVNADSTANTNIEVVCSKGVSAYVGISFGNSSNAVGRHMLGSVGNTDKLYYNVYKNSQTEEVWGISDGLFTNVSDGSKQIMTIYGKIGNYQTGVSDVYVTPDTYTDQLTVYVTY